MLLTLQMKGEVLLAGILVLSGFIYCDGEPSIVTCWKEDNKPFYPECYDHAGTVVIVLRHIASSIFTVFIQFICIITCLEEENWKFYFYRVAKQL